MTKAEGDHLGTGNHPGTTPSRSEVSSALSDLLLRVEGATADEEEVNVRAVFSRLAKRPDDAESAIWWGRVCRWLDAEAYESAALALVTRVLPGWAWHVSGPDSEPTAYACLAADHTVGGPEPWLIDRPTFDARAATPALALLAAMLKALADE